MAQALKDRYDNNFFNQLHDGLKDVVTMPSLSTFKNHVQNEQWSGMELKERMYRLAESLTDYLPDDFSKACHKILQLCDGLRLKGVSSQNFEYLFLPEFIAGYGLNHPEIALETIHSLTKFVSCEFAIRPFIIEYETLAMSHMKKWSTDQDENVRRFSSEGCRPRLPWGMALKRYQKDPASILPILENLKSDSSEYVRRSVANNLNDISKDHPKLVLNIAKKWSGQNELTDQLIKHALRTLLKKGIPEALEIIGFGPNHSLELVHSSLEEERVVVGDYITMQFSVHNAGQKKSGLRMEYAIYFLLKNGELAKKVFKITERHILPGETYEASKRHSMRPITTRTYYPGRHFVSLIVNGIEGQKMPVEIVV